MTIEDNNLDDFQGWDNQDEGNFFEQLEQQEPTPKSIKAEDVVDEVSKEEEIGKEEEGIDFFEETDTRIDDGTEEESEEETSHNNTQMLEEMKRRGFIDYELEEDAELEEEEIEELMNSSFEKTVEKRVEELFEALPEELRELNQFALNGGDIREFISKYSSSQNIGEDIDLDSENNQERVLRNILASEGQDEEEITTQIEYLKDSGKLESIAKKKYQRVLNKKKEEKQKLVEAQKQAVEEEKRLFKEAKKKASAFLRGHEKIGSLSIDKKDLKTVPSYMNDKTVKLQNGSKITQMQKELFYDLPQNEEAFMQLAILMSNRNEDGTFNFERIAKDVESKVTDEIKKGVRRNKSNIPTKSKRERKYAKKSLADYFN